MPPHREDEEDSEEASSSEESDSDSDGEDDWMRKHKRWGVIDPDSEKPGYGACLYNAEAKFETKTELADGSTTIPECLAKTVKKYGDSHAVGWREVVEVHQVDEGGAKREKIELENTFEWMTWKQYGKRVQNLSRGFSALGLKPRDKIVIYAETQRDWMVSAYAAFQQALQVVTIYASLGEEGATYGIQQTEATAVVVDARLLKILVKVVPACKTVRNIVTLADYDAGLGTQLASTGCNVYAIDELVAKGKANSAPNNMPTPDDIAVIMYTSGTTGNPKGVVISHRNVISTMVGGVHLLKGGVSPADRFLAYLPLAHIFELFIEVTLASLGVQIGYGSPHTLTDTGVKLKRPESVGDAPALKPTIMIFAPAVLDKVYIGVRGIHDTLPGPIQTLFDWGLDSGKERFDNGQVGAGWFYNLIFRKVRNAVGGCLRAAISGSAPLSPEIQKYMQTVLNVPIRQGYGLTETCAASTVCFWADNQPNNVGPPTISTVIRLADWQEGNYLNSDLHNPDIGMRRGEVLIGGGPVSQGYYINPANPDRELQKKNEEDWLVIDGIRFFRTGDIGQITKKGQLQIIDRKKDLWKGPQGEYVALVKVESALKMSEYTELAMCYGRTGASFPVALVCPVRKRLQTLAEELGVHGEFGELCRNPKVVAAVSKSLLAACKSQKLVEFEIPKKVGLIPDTWTPENDMLTAALKMKRPAISAKHKADIDALYS